jgi:dienelactone hydrolase
MPGWRAWCGAALASLVLGTSTGAAASRPGWPTYGLYRIAGGGLASVFFNQGYVRVLEYGNGEYRALREVSPGVWLGGPGATVFSPTRMRVRVRSAAGITVNGRTATLVPLLARSVGFSDAGVHFAARLLLPQGSGPFPGVVIVPGSERANEETYDLWAYFFAAQGFAVLTYDKRGVRGSGGTYSSSGSTANLQVLAADALAGLNWLRRQPQTDPTRVGLTGSSQAGWVIEMAAAHSHAVKFVSLQSSPAMSVGRQHAYDHITREGRLDPPPSDSQIKAELATVPSSGYDPAADIASLRIPVLWQLGGVDKRMYTPETLADLRQIESLGSRAFTVHVYPGGAHSLRLTANGLISEEKAAPGFCPGVFQDLAAWLKSTVLSSGASG